MSFVSSERELTLYFFSYMSSSVRLSVTFVRPTHRIEIFGNVPTPFGTLVI